MSAELGNWTKQQFIYTRNFWNNVQVSIYSNVAPDVEFSLRDRRKITRKKDMEKKYSTVFCFSYQGPKLFNSLPICITCSPSVASFRKRLKKSILDKN